jgi:hypothetical protein
MDDTARLDILLDVPIVFDVLGGAVVHSPMVHAVVGTTPTRLILDTGSTDHVLTRALVDRTGLPIAVAEDGVDHAGAAVRSWSVGELAVRIAGRSFDLHGVAAIIGPPSFDGWGVGGFLSPQHLHPGARVLVDLAADRLVLAHGDDRAAIDARLAARVPSLRPITLPRALRTSTVAVGASVAGGPTVPAMLNTGGRATEFARSAAPGIGGTEAQRGGSGVSGAAVLGADAGPQVLLVGGARVPVGRLVVRDGMDEPLGTIGMDVLRGTALICGADPAEPAVWLVPPTWLPA